MPMKRVSIIEPSRQATLIFGLYFLNHLLKSKEYVLLGQPLVCSTYKSWFENVSSLVVSLRTCLSPRIKPKAQYVILGPYPYNSPSKPRISFIREEERGFDF